MAVPPRKPRIHQRMERARKDGLPKKLDRACCVPITLFGLGSQLRIKETTKQVQHEATSCIGSYRTNTNREVPKGNDDHVTNGNGVRTVVFPTSVSLVEPDALGFDLHTPGLVSDATQVPMQVQAYSGQEIYRQMISKPSPNSDTSIGTASVTESDSPQHTGHVFVVALEDANVGMEIDHQSVASSAPGETAEEMEARVRREVETQIRQEMEARHYPRRNPPATNSAGLRLRSPLDRHPHRPRTPALRLTHPASRLPPPRPAIAPRLTPACAPARLRRRCGGRR